MSCEQTDCPFFVDSEALCGLKSYSVQPVSVNGSGNGLISASLEIGQVLASRKSISFSAKGTCMYPCIKQGDILYIDQRSVENTKVGDIAVIRRDGTLFGHRVVSKGIDEVNGPYIVTRPDRSVLESDGPTYQDGMLGIVNIAERKGFIISLDPMKMRRLDLLKVSLWEWWNWQSKPQLARSFFFIEQFFPYRHLAAGYLRMRYPDICVSVHVPLKPMQKIDLFQVFSSSEFDLSFVQQRGRPISEWTVQLELEKKKPAARVTFVRRPDGCPEGSGWYIGGSWCRTRYRGAGLESRLIEEARMILGRSGESLSHQI